MHDITSSYKLYYTVYKDLKYIMCININIQNIIIEVNLQLAEIIQKFVGFHSIRLFSFRISLFRLTIEFNWLLNIQNYVIFLLSNRNLQCIQHSRSHIQSQFMQQKQNVNLYKVIFEKKANSIYLFTLNFRLVLYHHHIDNGKKKVHARTFYSKTQTLRERDKNHRVEMKIYIMNSFHIFYIICMPIANAVLFLFFILSSHIWNRWFLSFIHIFPQCVCLLQIRDISFNSPFLWYVQRHAFHSLYIRVLEIHTLLNLIII